MPASPPRWTDRPFPPYAFLPGRDPHPTRDPAGHSYAAGEQPVPYRPAPEWRANGAYLYGVDLYNHGFLWEAHEAWEGLWHASKVDPTQAEFLQGLIQCAAACLKIPMGQPEGTRRLAQYGLGRLEVVLRAKGPDYMGLDLPAFVAAFGAFAGAAPTDVEARPRLELG